jgi:hypothetical protein
LNARRICAEVSASSKRIASADGSRGASASARRHSHSSSNPAGLSRRRARLRTGRTARRARAPRRPARSARSWKVLGDICRKRPPRWADSAGKSSKSRGGRESVREAATGRSGLASGSCSPPTCFNHHCGGSWSWRTTFLRRSRISGDRRRADPFHPSPSGNRSLDPAVRIWAMGPMRSLACDFLKAAAAGDTLVQSDLRMSQDPCQIVSAGRHRRRGGRLAPATARGRTPPR